MRRPRERAERALRITYMPSDRMVTRAEYYRRAHIGRVLARVLGRELLDSLPAALERELRDALA
jgi:hypothetical protein